MQPVDRHGIAEIDESGYGMADGYLGMFLHYSNSMCHDLLSSPGPTLHHIVAAGPGLQPMQAQLPVRRAMGMHM